MARQALGRLGRGSALALGLGLAAKELHDSFFEVAQVDARARLVLGLEPEALAARREREGRLRSIMAQAEGRRQELLRAHGDTAGAQQAVAKLRQQLVEEAGRCCDGLKARGASRDVPGDLSRRAAREAASAICVACACQAEEVREREVDRRSHAAPPRLFAPGGGWPCTWRCLGQVGAGEGQWQAELRRRGVDVVAFDDHSSPSRFGASSRILVPGAEVQEADAALAVSKSEGRTLLLVYPPPGSMAMRRKTSFRSCRSAGPCSDTKEIS